MTLSLVWNQAFKVIFYILYLLVLYIFFETNILISAGRYTGILIYHGIIMKPVITIL